MIHVSRNRSRAVVRLVAALVFVAFFALPTIAQDISPEMYGAMRWRSIGPFRAGRVTSVSGVPNQTAVYYIGTPGGGVWKTTDAGHVWKPIFDSEHIASIGVLAVSPSNPNIVYVGTGEQTQGNGVYKSTDAGATWKNVGLEKTHIITGMVVDPRNPDIVIVAAAGDIFSGAERGIFKTSDGGKSWQKVLFKDNDTSPMDLNMAPGNPKLLYTAMLRRPTPPAGGPPANPNAPREQDATIYKSTDEGSTWTLVGGKQTYRQPLTVLPDPRVHVSQGDLVQQLNTEKNISAQMAATYDGSEQALALRSAVSDRQKSLAGNSAAKDAADALKGLDDKAASVADGSRTELGLGPLNRELARLATMIESGDSRPATPLQAGVDQSCEQVVKRLAQWREMNGQGIQPVNTLLRKYNLKELPIASNIPANPICSK